MKKMLFLLVALFLLNGCSSSNKAVETKNEVKVVKTDSLVGKSWVLTNLNGDTIVVDTLKNKTPFFMLRTVDKITGNNGCNIFNGSYTMAQDTIKVSALMTTMMACPNVTYEDNFLAFFRENLVIISQKNDELALKNTVTNVEAKLKQIDVEN